MAVAITDEIMIGLNVLSPNSPRSTSAANIAPPMGALKVAARPPAAPHAATVRILLDEKLNSFPTPEPMAAPICTMGPSRPAEPPEPRVIADETVFMRATRGDMLRFKAMARITSGTPCPLANLNDMEIKPTISPPAAGIRTIFQSGAFLNVSSANSEVSP